MPAHRPTRPCCKCRVATEVVPANKVVGGRRDAVICPTCKLELTVEARS